MITTTIVLLRRPGLPTRELHVADYFMARKDYISYAGLKYKKAQRETFAGAVLYDLVTQIERPQSVTIYDIAPHVVTDSQEPGPFALVPKGDQCSKSPEQSGSQVENKSGTPDSDRSQEQLAAPQLSLTLEDVIWAITQTCEEGHPANQPFAMLENPREALIDGTLSLESLQDFLNVRIRERFPNHLQVRKLVDYVHHIRGRQKELRDDMMDYGRPDPELLEIVTILEKLI